nr:hypothetical protein CFP56_16269 [Quercus suber]
MFFLKQAHWAAVAYLAVIAKALPRPNPEVTYSVVDVDGGDLVTSPATTIYQTVTDSATPSPTTHSTSSITAKQVTDTVTELGATHTVSIGGTSFVTVHPTSTTSLASVISSPTTSSAVLPETVTVVSVAIEAPSSTSTTYYDDGMWHTTYPVRTDWGNKAVIPSPTATADDMAAAPQQAAANAYSVVSWDETTKA